jgi:hypothetical protein
MSATANASVRKPSNRGFWLVVTPMAAAGLLLVVLILLFRPRGGGQAVVRSNLRAALAAARSIERDRGSLAAATTLALRRAEPGLTFIDPDESSNDPYVISVYWSDAEWAAAARAESGTCLWIRATATGGTTFGAGSDCTGEAARAARSGRWPPTAP